MVRSTVPPHIGSRSRSGRHVHRLWFSLGVLIMVVFFAHSSPAIHGPGFSGSGFAGSPSTISATTMERGSWYVQVLADYLSFDTFSDAEFEEFSERGIEDVHDTGSVSSTSLSVAYGATPNLTFNFRLPYVVRKDVQQLPHAHEGEEEEEEEHGHLVEELGDSRGLGDAVLFGQYRFFDSPVHALESTLLFGLELPTGSTSERADTGERFEAELQPGSGSWDPMIGLAISKHGGSTSLHGNVLYFFSTEGTQNTRLGDTFYYNVAIARSLLDGPLSLDLSLEGNGAYSAREEVNGKDKPNSGGNIILLSPGMIIGYGSFSVNVSIGIPIVQDLNGVQNDVKYRLLLGGGYSF